MTPGISGCAQPRLCEEWTGLSLLHLVVLSRSYVPRLAEGSHNLHKLKMPKGACKEEAPESVALQGSGGAHETAGLPARGVPLWPDDGWVSRSWMLRLRLRDLGAFGCCMLGRSACQIYQLTVL